MKVKIVAQFGEYAHADLTKPFFVDDVRDHVAQEWVNNGWAIIVPEPKREKPKPAEEEPNEENPVVERAVIETPEDNTGVSERETAVVGRRRRRT